MRIAIIGSPRAGKTTLALDMGRLAGLPVLHTDDLIDLGWSAVSDAVALALLDAERDLILEGVAVVRGLRKALARQGAPVERCIVLERPRIVLTCGQRAMQRGCARMLAEIEPELLRRGVQMERPT